jgi:uncharacterized membrane protein YwaF
MTPQQVYISIAVIITIIITMTIYWLYEKYRSKKKHGNV